MQSDETALRKVDPYHLLFEGGQFYLVGYSHERDDVRVFRLSRIRGKVAYATKAEHDFQRPADFDPRGYANRIPWQLGDPVGTAEVWVSEDDRLVRRAPVRRLRDDRATRQGLPHRVRDPAAADLVGAELRPARSLGPPALVEEARSRVDELIERPPRRAVRRRSPTARRPSPPVAEAETNGRARGGEARRSAPSASPGWSRSPPC